MVAKLDPEILRVSFLDLFRRCFLRDRIGRQELDLRERNASSLVLYVRMERAQSGNVDEILLGLARHHEADEQPGGVRMRRILGDPFAAGNEWRSLFGVYNLNRRAAFLELNV